MAHPQHDAEKLAPGGRPPGPKGLWQGVSIWRSLQRDYIGALRQLQASHPDAASIRVAWECSVHVFHPELVRQLLVEQAQKLTRWERIQEVFALGTGADGILASEGARWKRQRRLMQSGFSPAHLGSYARHMAQACDGALRSLPGSEGQPPQDIQALMTQVTIDVIARALFGQTQGMDSERVSRSIHTMSAEGYAQMFRPWMLPQWCPWPSVQRARRAKKWLDQVIAQHIAVKRAWPAPEGLDQGDGDVLTMLLHARDPDHPEQGLSPSEVHDQAMVLFQAGHETSASALTWWAGLVASHPDVAQKLRQEVDSVLRGAVPDASAPQQLPWLMASVKEALRLYPPAAILMTRCSDGPLQCGPWRLSAGDLITVTPALIHRDPRWFADPDAFKPERFLPGAADMPRGAWMPFGMGPRVCLGQHFAMMEMGIIAAMLLQRFLLQWPAGQAWPACQFGITMRPAGPMRLQLTRRHPPGK